MENKKKVKTIFTFTISEKAIAAVNTSCTVSGQNGSIVHFYLELNHSYTFQVGNIYIYGFGKKLLEVLQTYCGTG